MTKTVLWFFYSCKRQLKHPAFLALLILLPLSLGALSQSVGDDEGGIAIALFAEDEDFADRVIEALEEAPGMFRFYRCSNVEELIGDVASRKAECGYHLLDGLKEKLDNKQLKRCIGVYTAPSTVTGALSGEVVFSVLFEVYGRSLMEDFSRKGDLFEGLDREAVWKEMEALYDKRLGDGSTFAFRYESAQTGTPLKPQREKAALPVRGIVSIYIFVIGLFSAVTLSTDQKKGLFIPVPFGRKLWCAGASMAAPVFLAACSGLCAIFLTGGSAGLLRETAYLAVYAAAVVIWAAFLKAIVKNPVILCSLIPFLAIGSLLLCPVFFDIGTWVPPLKALGKIFPPYTYLQLFRIR